MVRKLFILTFFVFLASQVKAQDGNAQMAQDFLDLANETYFNTRAILQANEMYVQSADLDPTNIEANYMAGRTYLETNYKSQATEYLLRVLQLEPDYKFNLEYMIGQSLQYGLKFDEAIQFYNTYLDKINAQPNYRGEDYNAPEEVERRIFESKNGKYYVNNPLNYRLENVGEYINSQWDDFAPMLNEDETMLVFSTKRQDGNLNQNVGDDLFYFEDIFITTKENDQWLYAQNIGEVINHPYHDSNLALSADGTELYIYRDTNNGDIYYSEYRPDGSWSKPEALEPPINSSFRENSFSISHDGSVAFFASNRPGSLGGLDIYYSVRDRRGEWGASRNLGSTINTPFDEDGPFIDYDGKTLYFSSKGHDGMGGFDIYKSVYDSTTQTWGQPINLGYPLNTPDNDIYFVSTRDGDRGYYASAKEDGGFGFTDIYQVWLPDNLDDNKPVAMNDPEPEENTPEPEEEPVVNTPEPDPVVEEPVRQPEPERSLQPVTLLLRVVNENTNEPINANVSLEGAEGVQVNVSQVDQGTYQAVFNHSNANEYQLNVNKEGFMYKSATIEIPGASYEAETLRRLIGIAPLQAGYKSVLRNIYFDYGKATLTSESTPELEKLRSMLMENPNLQAEISGHTDSSGPKEFNRNLSEKRAQAVVRYLVNHGINKSRLTAVGYGEARPLASNDDEQEGRELNRRVEFEILRNN